MKSYNRKKIITIAALAAAAVLLAGGLWVYLDSMGNREPDTVVDDNTTREPDASEAPDIEISVNTERDTQSGGTEDAGSESAGSAEAGSAPPVSGGQSKPSDGKPKTPAEATPPPAPPAETEGGAASSTPAQPESSTPKSGDTNDKGEIYVPGFGWIPNEGGGVDVQEGDFELSGELVGDM